MKKTKKFLSVLLVLIMSISLCLPAFAADNEKCPVIYINGIVGNDVYGVIGDESTIVGYPTTDTLINIVKDIIVPVLVKFPAERDTEALGHDIAEALNEEFKYWFNNPDGTAKENSGIIAEYPETVNKGSKLKFDYDWRGDPMVIAGELNDYINYVTEKSGSDKVCITAHSLGNVVLLSYLSLYGDDKIKGAVLDSPAIDGVTFVGQMLCGEIDFDGEALTYAVKGMLGEDGYAELLSSIVDIFDLAGIPEMLSVFLDSIIDELGPIIYKETLVPIFGTWLTIWAMTPDDLIDKATAYVFDDLMKDEDYSVLEGKIEAYNSSVRKNKKDTLLSFDENAKLAVISRYGYKTPPLTEAWSMISDGVIETQNSSLGATTTIIGEVFDDAYLENKDMKYISPDRTVDASTCLFPEKTWFIKNSEHAQTYVTKRLYDSFLFAEEELTCDTADMGRFSYYDDVNDVITEDNSQPEETKKLSAFERLFNFLKALLKKIMELFGIKAF